MKIDKETVDKLSTLAKLEFENEDKDGIINDLNRVLTFIDKLNELNTEGVEPLIYMSDEQNVMRADETHTDITQDEALKNAPDKDSDYFRVHKVIGAQ
ncbi:MAG: Asp-tRNA(Asn)/Glu-tRNA(Gln) amidotransferase subunit GatC [Bacteroidota bacterium]